LPLPKSLTVGVLASIRGRSRAGVGNCSRWLIHCLRRDRLDDRAGDRRSRRINALLERSDALLLVGPQFGEVGFERL
jgi:hypothetical protein